MDPVLTTSAMQGQQISPKYQLDSLREHQPYCPYVVRSSTTLSLLVASANGAHNPSGFFHALIHVVSVLLEYLTHASWHAPTWAIEGWRAVLMMVLCRLGQR
ncbi:hypothetical protein EI94DRAFT_1750251 [Lactarius quietus]|nr:hypothetical protein EI94DRAFT_1750251 [Lactarius quietus]